MLTRTEIDIAGQLEPLLWRDELLLAYPRGRHAQFQACPAKVTVFVPVYNAERRLLRCLQSIAAQSYVDFQVIVIDNGSTDQSFGLACGFAAKNPQFLVYQNARNVGRVGNWNRGLELAQGEYLKPLMVNDFLLPDCLAELVAALDAYPDVVMARASVTFLKDGEHHFSPLYEASRLVPGQEAIEFGLTKGNPAAGPSAQMFRRSVVNAHNLRFDTSLDWAADYDFAVKLLQYGDLYYIRQTLFLFEITDRFAKQADWSRQLRDELEVMGRTLERCRHRFGQETIGQVQRHADAMFGDCSAKCLSQEDFARFDSTRQQAQLRYPVLFPSSGPAHVAPAGSQELSDDQDRPGALLPREQTNSPLNMKNQTSTLEAASPLLFNQGRTVPANIIAPKKPASAATTQGTSPTTSSQIRELARYVGDDWKQRPYYDEAEAAMEHQWNTKVWPFIQGVDFSCVLDLAAGHGRNSEKLKQYAGKIHIVDINQENIDFCKQRFAGDPRFAFFRNDGCSLDAIPTGSISLVYCFDAMVHFDSDVVRAYLREFQRVLRPGAFGFCHHSNYTKNPGKDVHDNPGWRNFMSEALFAHYCAKEGLTYVKSQVLDWDAPQADCFTLFRKPL